MPIRWNKSTSELNQKQRFFFPHTYHWITAIQVFVSCWSLPVWRRSFFKGGIPPQPILAHPGFHPWADLNKKSLTSLENYEHFIPSKFHKHPTSGSGARAKWQFSLISTFISTTPFFKQTDDIKILKNSKYIQNLHRSIVSRVKKLTSEWNQHKHYFFSNRTSGNFNVRNVKF